MRRLYAFLITIGFLIPLSAMAQAAPEAGPELRSGQLVRVRSSEGQLQAAPAIDSVWVRGNRAKTGALVGALVFGAGSAVLGSAACGMASDGHGCQETGKVVAFTAAGAAAGAGLGALIGSAFGTWRLEYARPRASVILSPVSLDEVRLDVRLPL